MVNSAENKGVRGPAGDVVQVLRASSCDPECESFDGVHYKGTVLSDAQLALQALRNAAKASGDFDDEALFHNFGGSAVSPEILEWASDTHGSLQTLFCDTWSDCVDALNVQAHERGLSTEQLLAKQYKGADIQTVARHLAINRHNFSCGLDSMAHANKGAVGARLEFVDGVSISGLSIENIENTAELAHPLCQRQGQEYLGADARGMSIAVAKNIELGQDVRVHSIRSERGNAYGIEVRESTGGMDFRADIRNVEGKQGSLEVAMQSDNYAKGTYFLRKELPPVA
jgi:hypothetical protein